MTRSSFMKLMLGAVAMPSVATGCDLIGRAVREEVRRESPSFRAGHAAAQAERREGEQCALACDKRRRRALHLCRWEACVCTEERMVHKPRHRRGGLSRWRPHDADVRNPRESGREDPAAGNGMGAVGMRLRCGQLHGRVLYHSSDLDRKSVLIKYCQGTTRLLHCTMGIWYHFTYF